MRLPEPAMERLKSEVAAGLALDNVGAGAPPSGCTLSEIRFQKLIQA
jgi:hypothetical protein